MCGSHAPGGRWWDGVSTLQRERLPPHSSASVRRVRLWCERHRPRSRRRRSPSVPEGEPTRAQQTRVCIPLFSYFSYASLLPTSCPPSSSSLSDSSTSLRPRPLPCTPERSQPWKTQLLYGLSYPSILTQGVRHATARSVSGVGEEKPIASSVAPSAVFGCTKYAGVEELATRPFHLQEYQVYQVR